MLNDSSLADSEDDQLFFQKLFLSGEYDIGLDYEGYVFQCHEDEVTISQVDEFYNPITNCVSCIYHGNGDAVAKRKYDSLNTVIKSKSPMLYLPNYGGIDKISDDMFVIDFMTQNQCEDMIAIADRHGGWEPLPTDNFPAQEIRLKEIGYWDSIVHHWDYNVTPLIEEFYTPTKMYGLRDAFAMRYSLDTQRKLNLHTDASLVTGSIKLNDDYKGADLVFPRQNVSNKDVPVGKAIIFPGQVTHGHECTELEEGVKYSLTLWSKRFDGDHM